MHKALPMHRIPSHDPSPYQIQYEPPQHQNQRHQHQHARPRHQPHETRPVVTSRTKSGSLLRRGKTLTRPERAVAPVPLINPRLSIPGLTNSPVAGGQLGSRGGSSGGNVAIAGVSTFGSTSGEDSRRGINWWKVSSVFFTWWIPDVFLRRGMKLESDATRQAWREKVAFCWIAVLLGALVGFITMGLQRTLCPEEAANSSRRLSRVGKTDSEHRGWFFRYEEDGD
jgi:chitin synthase